jgi:hypothetical protein
MIFGNRARRRRSDRLCCGHHASPIGTAFEDALNERHQAGLASDDVARKPVCRPRPDWWAGENRFFSR